MNDYLFYESPEDALQKSIAASGKPQKEIASAVWPGRDIGTAKSLLTRALSPENTDVNLTITKVEAIMGETRPDDFIFYLCDKYGFDRPNRKTKKDMRREMEAEIRAMSKNLAVLIKRLPEMEEREGE